MRRIIGSVLCSLIGLQGSHQVAHGLDLVGSLTVSGVRLAIPEWQDDNSNLITSVVYDFTGVAENDPNNNVLSNNYAIKIVDSNDPGGPKSIRLQRPKDCTIGNEVVANNHVRFVIDGTAYGNSTISFTEGILYTSQLRFNSAGNYADKLGVVTYATSGAITYEY